MTISLEHLADPWVSGEPYSMADLYADPGAVVPVSITVTLTRDQMAGVLGANGHTYWGGDKHPDTWTVEEIRYFVGLGLASSGLAEIARLGEEVADSMHPAARPAGRASAAALRRAVDRAYPKTG